MNPFSVQRDVDLDAPRPESVAVVLTADAFVIEPLDFFLIRHRKHRPFGSPRRGFFIGIANPQYGRVVEQPAGDLQRKRQPVVGETVAHRQRRIAADVERRGERGAGEQCLGVVMIVV